MANPLSTLAQHRPYALGEADLSTKPVYQASDPHLTLTRNPRLAALDLMILTFAARKHAEWLTRLTTCPSDIAAIIRADLDAIRAAIDASPRLADGGPRGQPVNVGEGGTPGLWNATRPNVGHNPKVGTGEQKR